LLTEIEDENRSYGPFEEQTKEQNFTARQVKLASAEAWW